MIPISSRNNLNGYISPGMKLLFGQPIGTVSVERVAKRNWSVVGIASATDGRRFFVKQFLGPRRELSPRAMLAECSSARLAANFLTPHIEVSLPQAHIENRALALYPLKVINTPDEIIRRDHAAFRGQWPAICESMSTVLEVLRGDEALRYAEEANLKRRRLEGPERRLSSVCFKGLELRNVSLDPTTNKLTIFDLGPACVGPASEGVARVAVSALLLNWGRPLRRFRLGPPAARFNELLDSVGLDVKEACYRELDLQISSRVTSVKGASSAERTVKRALLFPFASRYETMCRRAIYEYYDEPRDY